MKPVTLRTVAREAGVSVATVSRVLAGQDNVAPETRERVEAVVARLGFRPNAAARALARRVAPTVGVITPDITTPFFASVMHGIEAGAAAAGLLPILISAARDARREVEAVHVLSRQLVTGILFLSAKVTAEHDEAFRGAGRPVVLVATSDPEGRWPAVEIDNRTAMADATRHLLALGHRAIAFIGGPPDDPAAAWPRQLGYRDAMREAGVPVDPGLVLAGDFGMASGQLCARKLLRRRTRPTAIVTASDEMAVGVLNAAWEAGIAVPAELSVVGFDDNMLATAVRPRLTTVAQPLYEMGRLGVAQLLEPPGASKCLPARVVVRESTREVMPSSQHSGPRDSVVDGGRESCFQGPEGILP